VIDALVGVIDLQNGIAVHAIAGQRSQYTAVAISPCAGDPIGLADQYRSRGLSRLYIADLDALQACGHQFDLIGEIVSRGVGWQEVHVDIGWTGDETQAQRRAVGRLLERFPTLRIIAATESARALDSLRELTQMVPASRLALGLDYRAGQLLGSAADEQTWLEVAAELNITSVVALDLGAVGRQQGVTTEEICRRVKQRLPAASLLSGGGIRSAADAQQLIEAGCSGCLVATALLQPLSR
jgi:phosphoribosylformimino-5-aminoimidazole carboxamide ribotide isomerase